MLWSVQETHRIRASVHSSNKHVEIEASWTHARAAALLARICGTFAVPKRTQDRGASTGAPTRRAANRSSPTDGRKPTVTCHVLRIRSRSTREASACHREEASERAPTDRRQDHLIDLRVEGTVHSIRRRQRTVEPTPHTNEQERCWSTVEHEPRIREERTKEKTTSAQQHEDEEVEPCACPLR